MISLELFMNRVTTQPCHESLIPSWKQISYGNIIIYTTVGYLFRETEETTQKIVHLHNGNITEPTHVKVTSTFQHLYLVGKQPQSECILLF